MNINKRELIISCAFVYVLLFVLAVFLYGKIRREKNVLDKKVAILEMKMLERNELIKNKNKIEKTYAWIKNNAPSFENEKQADALIFDFAQTTAKKNKLSIKEQKLLEQKSDDFGKISGIKLSVEGTYRNLFKWLYELQGKKNFTEIKKFTIKEVLESKNEKLVCEIELLKYFPN